MGWMEVVWHVFFSIEMLRFQNPGCSTADLGQLNYQRTVEQLVPQNLRRFFPPGKSLYSKNQFSCMRTVSPLSPALVNHKQLKLFTILVKCEPNTFYPPRCFFPMPAENLDTFLPPYFQFPTHLVQDNLVSLRNHEKLLIWKLLRLCFAVSLNLNSHSS